MSHIFDDREKGAEARYGHDQELRFKITVRRNRLIGEWAASKLGLNAAATAAFAKALVEQHLMGDTSHTDVVLIERLGADFKAKALDISPHRIRRHLDECLEEARRQVMTEIKPERNA